VEDTAFESVRKLREHLPTTWGPFLFHQTVAETLTVTYYDSLTKADVFYFMTGNLSPSPWFNLGTEILFERSGALRASIKASEGLGFTATANEVVSHIQKCIAGLVESAKRARRGETIYPTRLATDAVHYLLVADDLMSHRAPLGSSKRESLVPGSLTKVAESHLAVPPLADSPQYFSELSSAALELVSKAVSDGFAADATATRLKAALDQLILLSAGQ
jgi:hypothetical protein